MTPKKLVHLITGLGSGGAETMLVKLLRGMDKSRFTNVVVSLTDEGVRGEELKQAGIEVHCIGMKPSTPNPLSILKLIRLLRKEKPDLLQTWLYHSDLLGLIAGKAAGVPAIAWNIRCSKVELDEYSPSLKLVLKMLAKLSGSPTAVLVNSQAGKKVHEEFGYRPKSWNVLANGFDTSLFKPDTSASSSLKKELGVPSDCSLIGMVARFDPMKDHTTFLEAAEKLLKMKSNVHFVLVGRGVSRENPKLSSLIDHLNLHQNVHLLGERKDIPRLLAGLDIASLISLGEGFPNVVGESMACSIPSVSSDVGDTAWIVGDTGKVVPPRDSYALAHAWNEILSLSADARRNLGEKARQRVMKEFNLPQVVENYQNLYTRLIESSHD